jgi:hypothetical protein
MELNSGLVLLILWDAIVKCIGCWHAARNNQMTWFILMSVFSSAGILPVIYLSFCQKDLNEFKV